MFTKLTQKMIPFFSIAISVYNKASFVEQTLRSILNQSFSDFEIIIVDDGSTDNSLEVINTIKDNRISVYSIKNQGVAAARNYVLQKAKSNYIALCDGDDIWLENHLSELKQLIESFPKCGVYATSYEKHFFNRYVTQPKFSHVDSPFFGIVSDYFKTSLADNILWTSAVVIPRKTIVSGFVFDETLRCGEDIDLWIRIANTFKVAFSSKVTAHKMIFAEDNHLSLTKNIANLTTVLDKHKSEEKENPSLKAYLDINRFAIAMEAKILKDYGNYNKVKNAIDFKHLNFKLRMLLLLPSNVLRLLKKIKFFLLKKRLYNSPF